MWYHGEMNSPRAAGIAESIVRTLREPLIVLDADMRVKTASRAFYDMFRVSPEETVGRVLGDLGTGQWGSPALRALLDRVLPDDAEFDDFVVDREFPLLGHRTMLVNARALDSGDDLILFELEDITQRRELEAELMRQREWLQVALSSIGDAVIATDVATRVTFMNPTAERMTGWGIAEARGRSLFEVFRIVNEKTRAQVESPVDKAIREGAIVGLANHTVLIARDGVELHIDDSAAPIRDDRGEISGVIMVFHDISERRRIESVLEVSEVRYRRLFEAAHDGILLVNAATGKIEDANPFMHVLLGYPREHFIGKELWQIGLFCDAESSKRAMEELKRVGQIRYEDLPLEDRNGLRIPVEFVSNVYVEGQNSIIQCNVRDISLRKRHERERDALLANEQAARMEADAANRTKDLFLATLSHEMRTPLNTIVVWGEVLRRRNYADGELREGIDAICVSAKAQAQLIEDVLDVSRIVSGKLELDVRPCQLDKVISAAVEIVRPAAEETGVGIVVSLDPEASDAMGDPARIQQVVWNLLSNAVKFTPKGGTVRVTLSRGRSSSLIVVSDSGRGIEADFLPYVFDRFRQADSTTRRKFGGLGLGLSIAKQLVELHGGTLKAASEGPGKGATFTVELPVRAVLGHVGPTGSDGGAEPPRALFPEVRLDGLRVLIVDDDPIARRAVLKALEEAGAVVTAAGSVVEAIARIAKDVPEVLVSDIAMPDEDGYDLIRRVRAAGHSVRDLPAVALTAFAHKEDRRRALLAGFQVHVAKPVDPQDLTAIIGSLVGRTGVS